MLRSGEPLLASRVLAARLGVARGVVVAAYEQLVAEGYLASGQGVGTRVHPELRPPESRVTPKKTATTTPAKPSPSLKPLSPGVPDTSAVNTPAWRAAWRSAASRAHLEAPELGDPRLREGIAEHLRRMRGTPRSASDVIVTAGTRDGLGLLLTALGTTHGRRLAVGVEDPGYPSLRRVAARHGADIVALPVDSDGLDTSALPERLLDVLIVTPSHQYPLGGSLPLARRHELLAWAARTGVIVVEDDYDSELRHTGNPLPALAALDDPISGSVVLLGTFSKTVSQSLSAGFLLAPEGLRSIIEPVRHDLGGLVPAVVQAALADYLESGELRRHTAKMRRRYAARREMVLDRLGGIPGVQVRAMSGGLHVVLQFAEGAVSEERIRAAATQLGAIPLSAYWQRRSRRTSGFGLVIGTGTAAEQPGARDRGFEEALDRLRRILIPEHPGHPNAEAIAARRE